MTLILSALLSLCLILSESFSFPLLLPTDLHNSNRLLQPGKILVACKKIRQNSSQQRFALGKKVRGSADAHAIDDCDFEAMTAIMMGVRGSVQKWIESICDFQEKFLFREVFFFFLGRQEVFFNDEQIRSQKTTFEHLYMHRSEFSRQYQIN